MLTLESSVSGFLETTPAGKPFKILVLPLELKERRNGQLLERSIVTSSASTSPQDPHESILTFCESLLGCWREDALDFNSGKPDHIIELFDSMLKVIRQIDAAGVFTPDMHQRNIMAQVSNSGSLSITGILEWDEAVFAPSVVACEPPWWLWDDNRNDHHVDSNHLGTWPYECSGANDMPKTSEQQELRHIFEDEAGSK